LLPANQHSASLNIWYIQTHIYPRNNLRCYIVAVLPLSRDGIAQSVWRLAKDWTVRGLNIGVGETFRTRPDRSWGPHSLLYNFYRLSFPGVKRPGRGVYHPPTSSAEVKERVELYMYSPLWASWPVIGGLLPFTLLSMSRYTSQKALPLDSITKQSKIHNFETLETHTQSLSYPRPDILHSRMKSN